MPNSDLIQITIEGFTLTLNIFENKKIRVGLILLE